MGKRIPALFILTACLLVTLFPLQASAVQHTAVQQVAEPQTNGAGKTVFVVYLTGEIGPGLNDFLERSFSEAKENDAAAIILQLNTPGGYVNTATGIRTLIQDSQIPVYAYVRHNAISAGAFLALSCRALYMAPGSTIGAAEIQSLTGGDVDEKSFSYWEGEMRTAAEQQGKDPQIAAAMVRKSIEIENLVDSGKILTLTAAKAQEIGFTDGVFNTRSDLYAELGLSGAKEVMAEETPAERFARFVTRPQIATLLVTIGLAALVIEVLAAGFGIAGIISIAAFTLYFGGHIAAGLAGQEVIFLFVAGIILLVIEAFIPSFGIVGIGGLAAIIASIVLAAATTGTGLLILLMSIFLTVIVVAALYQFLKKTNRWSHIILQYAETKDRGYVGPSDYSHLVGKEGVTLTTLRPAGTAEFDGERIDVVSEGSYIAAKTKIKVIKVEGTRVIVRAQSKND